jgi:hypothetical protein
MGSTTARPSRALSGVRSRRISPRSPPGKISSSAVWPRSLHSQRSLQSLSALVADSSSLKPPSPTYEALNSKPEALNRKRLRALVRLIVRMTCRTFLGSEQLAAGAPSWRRPSNCLPTSRFYPSSSLAFEPRVRASCSCVEATIELGSQLPIFFPRVGHNSATTVDCATTSCCFAFLESAMALPCHPHT